jgi:hypothetical protein
MPGVPRWAHVAAHTAALITLPSGLWRIALVAGVPLTSITHIPAGEKVYIVGLSLVAEGAALLTLGLVRPWGEAVPAWVPLLGGRRVPPMAAVVPAAAGAAALTAIWGYAFAGFVHHDPLGTPVQTAVLVACYAPLLAWGPLLGAVTFAYARRRGLTAFRVGPGATRAHG